MRTVLAVLLAALPAAAQTPPDSTRLFLQKEGDAAPARVSDGIPFALALHARAAKDARGGNFMLSPYSVRQCFAMAWLGAAGATRAEMEKTFGIGAGFEKDQADLRARLTSDDQVLLMIGNALWLKDDFPFLKSFVARARKSFGAEVRNSGFGAGILEEINSWASRATNGRIPKILNDLSSETRAVLVNAVYFKGKWETAFPKQDNDRKGDSMRVSRPSGGPLPVTFRTTKGEAFETKLMSLRKNFAYAQSADWQAVRLPYRGGRLAMLVVLPAEGSSLDALRSGLDAPAWARLRGALGSKKGLVAIPRFKFTDGYNLVALLKGLGLNLPFERFKADFSAMAAAKTPEDRLYVQQAVHKTFVAVDEEGTEAAAVSAIAMSRSGAAREEEPFRFVADRPFLFAIEEVSSGEILFLGEVHDPRK